MENAFKINPSSNSNFFITNNNHFHWFSWNILLTYNNHDHLVRKMIEKQDQGDLQRKSFINYYQKFTY